MFELRTYMCVDVMKVQNALNTHTSTHRRIYTTHTHTLSLSLSILQVIILFLQLWPSLTGLISQWASDQDIVEVSLPTSYCGRLSQSFMATVDSVLWLVWIVGRKS